MLFQRPNNLLMTHLLFTVVYDVDIAANKLNRNLDIILYWACQRKLHFNLDINKQAIQVIFSQKKSTVVTSGKR